MTLPIITRRLKLRRFADSDAADIVELVSHPSVAQATPEIRGTAEGARTYISHQNALTPFQRGACFDLAIERRADGKVIGLLSIVMKEHRAADLGYALSIEHRGRGYAAEAAAALIGYAFSELGLHRIAARTTSVNEASWKLMERLGMRREAHMREAEWRDGEWLDRLIYGLLAHEWPATDQRGSGRG